MTEQRSADQEVYASSECPHCGIDTPHQHFIDRKGWVHGFIDPNEILGKVDGPSAYDRDRQKAARDQIDAELGKHIEGRLLGAMAVSKEWNEACRTCRMFSWRLKEARISVAMYMADREYGMVAKGDAFYCPDCNQCVWSNER